MQGHIMTPSNGDLMDGNRVNIEMLDCEFEGRNMFQDVYTSTNRQSRGKQPSYSSSPGKTQRMSANLNMPTKL